MKKGKFIVIDGIGGCGKTTQVEYAYKLLKKNGFKVISTREPGGIKAAEVIRNIIFEFRDKKLIGAEAQIALFYAARKFWMDGIVRPALSKGISVISDRSYTTTGAYQGYAEHGDMQNILKMADIIMGKDKPDRVILVDVSAKIAKERNNPKDDPFDKEKIGYFKKIISGFRKMAADNWGGIKWHVVNGEGTIEEVSTDIKSILEKIFDKKLK